MFTSRQKAVAQVMSGNILVDDEPVTKAGTLVSVQSVIRIKKKEREYVSRGALKLLKALSEFQIEPKHKIGMDIGSSTGGFTQVLLEQQCQKIYAVDVGTNQLDYSLRKQEKIIVLENTNARYLEFEKIGEKADLIVIDLSFISILKVMPALVQFGKLSTDWITLIKPQFEAGRDEVQKGGIVKKESVRQKVIKDITQGLNLLGLNRLGLIESPIKGTKGNLEYLAWWKQD